MVKEKSVDINVDEMNLILQIKKGKDDALIKLYQRYYPLVYSVKRKYYVRYYDDQDWNQDALIICHASAMNFNQSKGKFGSYYKTRLTNHAKTLIRYNSAYRRKAMNQSISLDAAREKGLEPIAKSVISPSEIPLSETLANLIANLSDLEISALLIELGIIDIEDVLQKFGVDQVTILRARSRLSRKMRHELIG
jgi:RNA polymerase sporulation-specific sigma factor